MITSVEIENGSSCDLATPLLGALCQLKRGLDIVYLCAKLNDCNFIRSRDIIGAAKITRSSANADEPCEHIVS